MHILISGGTGFVGSALSAYLVEQGHTVILLSSRIKSKGDYPSVLLPPKGELLEEELMEQIDGIVNLAGASISSGRWTKEKKEEILESRLHVTRILVNSIARNKEAGKNFPKVMINASAVGFYGTDFKKQFRESDSKGAGFLADVASKWEEEAKKVEECGTRLSILRFGIVLGPGGMLAQMEKPFHYFVGGKIGSGQQWISWIHRRDLVTLIGNILEDTRYQGIYNACSPNPVTMSRFSKALGKALKKPAWTFLPSFIVKLVFGEMAEELLLNGQIVVPEKLEKEGYQFLFTEIEEALEDIYRISE